MQKSLDALPPEIIGEILDHLPPRKIHRLATISKKFHAGCSRILHKHIELRSFQSAKQCCETLAFDHIAAGCVKTLSLTFPDQTEVNSQFTRLLRSALQNTSRTLTSLELKGFASSSSIKRLSFPRLKHFTISSPFNPDIAVFLASHPNLEQLRVLGPLALSVKSHRNGGVHAGMHIPMPQLREFSGPPGSCPILLSPESEVLEEVEVTSSGTIWRQEFIDSIPHTIRALGFKDFAYRQSIFDAVGQRLTGLTKLTLGFSHPNQVEIVLDGLVSLLPNLGSLHHLKLTPPPTMRVDFDRMDESILDMDYAILSKVTEHCETLAICDSFSTLTWARLALSGQWLPLFPTPVGIHWWFQRTQLCTRLQRRMITHLANDCGGEDRDLAGGVVGDTSEVEDAGVGRGRNGCTGHRVSAGGDEDSDDDEDDIFKPYQPNVRKLAKAVGFIVNRSFGFSAADAPAPATSSAEVSQRLRSEPLDGNADAEDHASRNVGGSSQGIAQASSSDSEDSDDDDGASEYEQLCVPIRDFDGRILVPYSSSPHPSGSEARPSSPTSNQGGSPEGTAQKTRFVGADRAVALWDTFASVLGFVTLHPVPVFLANVDLFDMVLPVISTPPPVLGEEQQELLRLIMDLVWNSFIEGSGGKSGSQPERRRRKAGSRGRRQKVHAADPDAEDDEAEKRKDEKRRMVVTDDDDERVNEGKGGIKLKNYFRNPQDVWGERNLMLGVASDDVVIPLGDLF